MAETLEAALLGVQFNGISRVVSLGAMDETDRAEALLALLQRLAQDSGHQESVDAPVLVWGHSGAAVAAASIADRLPDRTLAFVRYHSGAAAGGALSTLRTVPALLLSGGKEENASNAPATEGLWKRGRVLGAPWTFAIERGATHGDPDDLAKANDLVMSWITAVLKQRLPLGATKVRSITDQEGWTGNHRTGEVLPYGPSFGSSVETSWLPDEASARAWQRVTGTTK